MTTTITRRYAFEAAHRLPGVPDTHKCSRMHGHNYEIEVSVMGAPDGLTGFVIDFWDMDKLVDPIVELVDHRTLNDIPGLQNPTAEHIAAWFAVQIRDKLDSRTDALLTNVRVFETKNCWADYEV